MPSSTRRALGPLYQRTAPLGTGRSPNQRPFKDVQNHASMAFTQTFGSSDNLRVKTNLRVQNQPSGSKPRPRRRVGRPNNLRAGKDAPHATLAIHPRSTTPPKAGLRLAANQQKPPHQASLSARAGRAHTADRTAGTPKGRPVSINGWTTIPHRPSQPTQTAPIPTQPARQPAAPSYNRFACLTDIFSNSREF
jgi:hypothetical protein